MTTRTSRRGAVFARPTGGELQPTAGQAARHALMVCSSCKEMLPVPLSDIDRDRKCRICDKKMVRQSSELDAIAAAIIHEHKQVKTGVRYTLEHAAKAGRLLAASKKICGHGKWLPFLKEKVGIAPRRAQRLIRIHRELQKANATSMTHLPELTMTKFLKAVSNGRQDDVNETSRKSGEALGGEHPSGSESGKECAEALDASQAVHGNENSSTNERAMPNARMNKTAPRNASAGRSLPARSRTEHKPNIPDSGGGDDSVSSDRKGTDKREVIEVMQLATVSVCAVPLADDDTFERFVGALKDMARRWSARPDDADRPVGGS